MKRFTLCLTLVAAVVIACFWLRNTRVKYKSEPTAAAGPSVTTQDGTALDETDEAAEDPAEKWVAISDQWGVLTNKALPEFKNFLSALAGAGLSPVDPNLSTNRVRPVEAGSNKYVLTCRFLVDDKWVVSFDDIPDTEFTTRFVGITDFGLSGLENPYRHVSAGDTNRLATLARDNPMSSETAAKLLSNALAAVLRKQVPAPEVNAQRYYGYDMNRWKGRWWKPGADHWNQLNIQHSMVIQPRNPTQAVVVAYHRRAGQ